MSTRDLYQLHLLDVDIHDRESDLSEVIRQLEDDEALKKLKQLVSSRTEELAGLDREQRDVDNTLSDLQTKLKSVEQKAYGGSITNPRELEGYAQEAAILKRRIGDVEEKSLILMEKVDEARTNLEGSSSEFAALETQRNDDLKRLADEKARLEVQLSDLGKKRQGLAAAIDRGAVGVYESVRNSRGVSTIAKVERGMCQGCRITLPVGIVQRARVGQEVVQCTSCSRILYVS